MHKMKARHGSSDDAAAAGRPTAAEDWKDLPLLDRIAVITRLRCAGNSNRSIGRMLNVDEGTIRRLLRIAVLPESSKLAIAKGASANRILGEAGRNGTEGVMARDVLINRYAELIVRWLQEHGIIGPYAERVLLDVDGGLAPSSKRTEGRQPRFSYIAAVIQDCRPATLQDAEHHLNPFIRWGKMWISRVVPRDLLTRVIAKPATLSWEIPVGALVYSLGASSLPKLRCAAILSNARLSACKWAASTVARSHLCPRPKLTGSAASRLASPARSVARSFCSLAALFRKTLQTSRSGPITAAT